MVKEEEKIKIQIEWITTLLNLCINKSLSEGEKKKCFVELEKMYHSFSADLQINIRSIIREQLQGNQLIYILSVIIRYTENGLFKEELMDCLISGDFSCNVASSLEYQTLIYVRREYARKRIFHRKNMDKFSRILVNSYEKRPVYKRNKNRIVIITGQILSDLHAPTRMILDIAYILQKHLGYELLFFICPCDEVLPSELWYRGSGQNSLEVYHNQPMERQHRDTVFMGYQINMDERSSKEYNMMFSLVHAWNPMFVLDCDTVAAVADLMGTCTTLVSMRMSVECPISEGDVLIRLGREDEQTEIEYEEALNENQTQLFLKEKFPVIMEENQAVCTRLELGLPEGQFLIAIVGNRLEKEIDDKFAFNMKKILREIPKAAFVVIGFERGIFENFKDDFFKGRIFYLGYRKDLMRVYGCLDLYLNPPRKGGGFSSAMALLAGIPVVTLPDCDVAYNCGEDFVVQDYEDMVSLVCRYAQEPLFYNQMKEIAQNYKKKNAEEQLVQFVKEMLDGILNIIEGQEEKC